MTILNFNRKRFEKDVGKLDEKMQENIALFGTPVENLSDDELQIEIFPNRPDLLSYGNYVNAFNSFLGKKTGLRKIKINKPEKDFVVNIDSSIANVRPYTVCAIVKNLKLTDDKIKEIIDIQEKLHLTLGRKRKKVAIGVYPLEKIKLPISYKAMKPEEIKFRPLEFPNELTGRQILVKHPAGRDYGMLLNGLDKFPVFVDANNQILSMPPIINSHETGKITLDTKNVFIECSGFDFDNCNKILNILIMAFEFMGGKIYQINLKGNKNILTPDLIPEKIKLSIANVNRLLGLDLKEKEIKNLLEKMGHDYNKGFVFVSSSRADVLHEVDLIEDIAIAYGYDKFIPEIPQISTIGNIDSKEIIKKKISEILIGLGLIETMSYHLISKDSIKKLEDNPKEYMPVKNSKTEHEFLRKNLSNYLLKIFSENVDVEYPQEIFQIGRVFEELEEKDNLAIAMSPGNFTKLKQILDYFSKMLNMELIVEEASVFPNWFIEGRVVSIVFNGKEIGFFGEVHPKILDNFKIKLPVALLEISLNEIMNFLI